MELFPPINGTFAFDWLSAVLILIVVLFMIEGIAKGGMKTFLNHFGGLIVAVLSFIAALFICNYLVDMDFTSSIREPIKGFFLGIGGEEGAAVMGEVHNRDEVLLVLTNNSYALLTGLLIPLFLCPFVAAFFGSCVPETVDSTSLNVAEYFARGVTALLIAIIAFIIISIILSIILGAIKKAVHKRQKVKKPGFISRLFGFIFGTAIGIVWALVVVWVFKLLFGIQFFHDFLTDLWKLEDESTWTLGEYLYKVDYITKFIDWITSFFA